MTTPYRDSAPPRLWRPGVIRVDVAPSVSGPSQGFVRHGPCVGWADFGDIEDWKKDLWLVDKRTIPVGVDGPTLPETLLGPGRWGRIRQAALATPLVVVTPPEAVRLAGSGARVIHVGWHRGVDSGTLVVQQGEVRHEFNGGFFDVTLPTPRDPELDLEDHEQPVNFDRLLRAFTNGEVDEAQVTLADALAWATADGGPRLDAWEAWLAEIFARADTLRAEIDAVAGALRQGEAEGVSVSTAWAPLVAHTLEPIDVSWEGGGAQLPRQTRFTVAGVVDWRPTSPNPFHLRLPTAPSEHRARIWVAVVFAVAAALWYLAKR